MSSVREALIHELAQAWFQRNYGTMTRAQQITIYTPATTGFEDGYRAALAAAPDRAAATPSAGLSKPIVVDVESPSAAQAQGAAPREPTRYMTRAGATALMHAHTEGLREAARQCWQSMHDYWQIEKAVPDVETRGDDDSSVAGGIPTTAPTEVAQEPPAPPEDKQELIAMQDGQAALKIPDVEAAGYRAGWSGSSRYHRAALEAQRGEIERLERRQDCAVVEYAQAEADLDASRDDAIKGWSNYRTADQQAQALRKELTAARDLAAQLARERDEARNALRKLGWQCETVDVDGTPVVVIAALPKDPHA